VTRSKANGYLITRMIHDCKKKNGSKQDNHSNNNGNNNDISLEVVLMKLESIGITIDTNRLKNVK
jgi:DNA polymerase I-like protein with 3'-5' exonuclease and polymerase domains